MSKKYSIVEENDVCYIKDSENKYMLYVFDNGNTLGTRLMASKYGCKKNSPAYELMKKVVKELNETNTTSLQRAYFFANDNEPNQEGFEKACQEFRNKYNI